MADLTPEELREITSLAQQVQTTYREIGEEIERAAASQRDLTVQAAIAVEGQRALSGIAKKISEFTEKDFQSKKKQTEFFKEIDKLQTKRFNLELQLRQITELQKNARGEEKKVLESIAKKLSDSLTYTNNLYNETRKIEQKFRDIDRASNWIESLADLTRSVPLIGPAIDSIATSWRKASGYLNESKSNLEKTGIVVKSLGTLITIGLIRNVFKLNQDITEFARNTELSQKAANKATEQYRDLARQVEGLETADLTGAATAFSKELGVSAALSSDIAERAAILTKRFGVTADQAAKLQKFTLATNQDFKEFTNGVIGSVEAYNALNKTAFSTNEIFQSISTSGAATQVSVGRFKNGLVDAAIEAKKLGTTLKGIEGIQENLLNFEQSIAAELEAELLTGRQINFERARYYALTNDLEGLTREIANNVGSLAEFQEMNYFAQLSTAKAYGLQRDQLAEMLMQSEALEEIKALGFSSEKDYTAKLEKRLKSAKSREEREKIVSKFGDTELARRISQVSAQERLNELQEEIATSMAEKLIPALNSFVTKVDDLLKMIGGGDIGKGIERIGRVLTGLAAVALGMKVFPGLVKGGKRVVKYLKPAPPTTPPAAPAPTTPPAAPTPAPPVVPPAAPAPTTPTPPTGRLRDARGRYISTKGTSPMPSPPSGASGAASRLRGGRAGLITAGLMALGLGANAMSSEEEVVGTPEIPGTMSFKNFKDRYKGTEFEESSEMQKFLNPGRYSKSKVTAGIADPFTAPVELLMKLYDVLSRVDTSNKEVAKTVTEQTSYRYAVDGL